MLGGVWAKFRGTLPQFEIPSGKNQFIGEIEASLAQHAGNRVVGESRCVIEHAYNALLFDELDALDAIHLAHAIECSQFFLSWLRLIVECDLKVRHCLSPPKATSQFTL